MSADNNAFRTLLRKCLIPWEENRTALMEIITLINGSTALVKRALPFHSSAWNAVSEPIQLMLSAATMDERDRLTALWRDNTQSQLSVVCITVKAIHNLNLTDD